MKNLKVPRTEADFAQMKALAHLTDEEKAYIDDLLKKRKALFGEKWAEAAIPFYREEIAKLNGKFNGRVAVERNLRYCIGLEYEGMGTYSEKIMTDLERMYAFGNAVFWYQSADELVGFLTDYAMRQTEALGGFVHYRREAGLDDEIARAFSLRRKELFNELFGGRVTVIQEEMPEMMKKGAKVIGGAVKAYIHHPGSN